MSPCMCGDAECPSCGAAQGTLTPRTQGLEQREQGELDALRRWKKEREAQLRGGDSGPVLDADDADYLRMLACSGRVVVTAGWLRHFAAKIDASLAPDDSPGARP